MAGNSAKNFYVGAIVEFNTGSKKLFNKIKDIVGASIIVAGAFATLSPHKPDGGAPAGFITTASTCEFDLMASWNSVAEQFRFLTMDNVATANYYGEARS